MTMPPVVPTGLPTGLPNMPPPTAPATPAMPSVTAPSAAPFPPPQAPTMPGMSPGMPVAPVGPQPWPPQMLYGPQGLPIWWQDDPSAHLTVLNEIILDERKPFALRKLAADRSTIYEQLAQAKADPTQPVPAEVLGVPLNRLVVPIGGAAPGGSLVPTAQGQPAVTTPDAVQSGPSTGTAPGMTDHAQPLGTVGAVEQGMRQ